MIFDTLTKFAEFFYNNVDRESIEYNGRTLLLKVINKKDKEFEELCDNILEWTIVYGSKYELKLNKCKIPKCFLFYENEDFFKKFETYQNEFNESHILILNSNSYSLKKPNEVFTKEKALIFNYKIYRELIVYFKENIFFTTLNNDTDKQILILSKENGIFHLGYKLHEIRIDSLTNLSISFEKLKLSFEKKEFIQFFKENVVSGIHLKDVYDRFYEMISNLDILLSLTEKDYENYVLNFSFEKIKAKFKEERNKYFESLDKSIEAVNKQVISFPLTFAATIFASYQVKDKPWILIFIFISYLLYTIIAFKVLNISRYNIKCIKDDVTNEKKQLEQEYNKNYIDFKSDFDKIDIKILNLKKLTDYLKVILFTFLISFFIYTIIQIFSKKTTNNSIIAIPIEKIQSITIDTTLNKTNESDYLKKKNKELKTSSIDSIKVKEKDSVFISLSKGIDSLNSSKSN